MGLVSFAGVTLAFMAFWFLAAGRIVKSENTQQAAQMYEAALKKAGPAYGVFALWSFGVRVNVDVAALVGSVVEYLSQFL